MGPVEEGLLIGIGSGVSVSLIVGLMGWVRHRFRRRQQIVFIRRLILEGYKGVSRNYGPFPPDIQISDESLQKQAQNAAFEAMYSRIQDALQGRAKDMTYDQIEGVRNAFFDYEWLKRLNRPVNEEWAGKVFDQLWDLPFLKPPPR